MESLGRIFKKSLIAYSTTTRQLRVDILDAFLLKHRRLMRHRSRSDVI